jgi:hypothetical protein
MAEETRTLRNRLEGLSNRFDAAGNPPIAATGRMVVQVFDGGKMPSSGQHYFLGHPVSFSGDEQEGNTDTGTADTSASVVFFVLGTVIPQVGDRVVITQCGNRWVSSQGSGTCCCGWWCDGAQPESIQITDSILGTFDVPRIGCQDSSGNCTWQLKTPIPYSGTSGTGPSCPAGAIVSVSVTAGGSNYTSAPSVAFSGGTGATATADIAPGPVTALNLVAAGTGYTLPPVVAITGGGGVGAAGTAVLSATSPGTVDHITVTSGGMGYTGGPTVTLTPAVGDTTGSGAAANASIAGNVVTRVNITAAGHGYPANPAVTFSGGGGTGAAATATAGTVEIMWDIRFWGIHCIASLSISNGGHGYSSAAQALLSAGSGATAVATLAGTAVGSITVTNGGSGYGGPPWVSISGGGGTGATATASITGGVVTAITVTNGGSGYTGAPTVTIGSGGGAGSATLTVTGGTGATATCSTVSGGVSAVTMTALGSGYSASPTITFVGGGGSGATATATVTGGIITGVTVTAAGTGYTAAPEVVITDGVISGIWLTDPGSDYGGAPVVTIDDPYGTGAAITATTNPIDPGWYATLSWTWQAQANWTACTVSGGPCNGQSGYMICPLPKMSSGPRLEAQSALVQLNCSQGRPWTYQTASRNISRCSAPVTTTTTATPPAAWWLALYGGSCSLDVTGTPVNWTFAEKGTTPKPCGCYWFCDNISGNPPPQIYVTDPILGTLTLPRMKTANPCSGTATSGACAYCLQTTINFPGNCGCNSTEVPVCFTVVGQALISGSSTNMAFTVHISQVTAHGTATGNGSFPGSCIGGPYTNPFLFDCPDNYSQAYVTITPAAGDSTGSGGTAVPVLSGSPGSVTSIKITNPGTLYSAPPTVAVKGGGGSGATAYATIDPPTGKITAITVTAGGSGYYAPSGGCGPVGGGISCRTSGSGLFFCPTAGGKGYTSAPSVGFSGGGGMGATADAMIHGGAVVNINVTNGGSGYTSPPTVTLTGGGFTTAATATATVSSGKVKSVGLGSRPWSASVQAKIFPTQGVTTAICPETGTPAKSTCGTLYNLYGFTCNPSVCPNASGAEAGIINWTLSE